MDKRVLIQFTASWDQNKLTDKFRQNFNSVDFIFNEKVCLDFLNYFEKLTVWK